MQKIFSILALLVILSGCVHKNNIEQGNIITPDMTNQIHLGMTENDVKDIMGTPMLLNTFADNRIDYVYTYKPGYGDMTEKYLTLTFSKGRLRNINKNV